MTAAASTRKPARARILLLGFGAAVVVLVGVVLSGRGPDLSYLPDMAARPISLPDGQKIYAQRHEVTIAEWNACAAQGGCSLKLRARPDQDATKTPATGLSFVDAQEYVGWISETTGHSFRLPSASEWREMASAVLPNEPNPIFTDPSLTWASAYLTEGATPRALKPQGSFSVSPEGVVDLDGSVWEWTQECYAGSIDGVDRDRCPAFFVGGEHVAAMSFLVRDPARGGCAVSTPPAHLGMRLVTDEPI